MVEGLPRMGEPLGSIHTCARPHLSSHTLACACTHKHTSRRTQRTESLLEISNKQFINICNLKVFTGHIKKIKETSAMNDNNLI